MFTQLICLGLLISVAAFAQNRNFLKNDEVDKGPKTDKKVVRDLDWIRRVQTEVKRFGFELSDGQRRLLGTITKLKDSKEFKTNNSFKNKVLELEDTVPNIFSNMEKEIKNLESVTGRMNDLQETTIKNEEALRELANQLHQKSAKEALQNKEQIDQAVKKNLSSYDKIDGSVILDGKAAKQDPHSRPLDIPKRAVKIGEKAQ